MVKLVLFVIVALLLIYAVGGARPWPLEECRRCGGKGRYMRVTWTGRRVARDCPYCQGGWVNRGR